MWKKILSGDVLVFDGGIGTILLEKGLKPGTSPELLNLTNPQMIEQVHIDYLESGADIITTNTFGGSKTKLLEYGLENKIEEINMMGVQIARKVADKYNKYVAASVGPTGEFLEPMGQLSFEEMYKIFKEQISALVKGKPDFILLETFHDLGEIRAALLASKDISDIPVICSMTFENARTLTGASPVSAAIVLEAMGASVIGANCSGGPGSLFNVLKDMSENTELPLIVQPNAGLPKFIDDKVVYSMDVKEFVKELEPYYELGVNIIGSCCGSTPLYTKVIKERVKDYRPHKRQIPKRGSFASKGNTVFLEDNKPSLIIGERINPTGNKELSESLRNKDFGLIQKEAQLQLDTGAHILDINVGTYGIDEKEIMVKIINLLQQRIDIPLCIDSTDPLVIKEALQVYNGRALVNSINGDEEVYEEILPMVKRYGASVVALTLDNKGIPKTAEGRYKIAERIVKACDKYGISREDIYIDCLAMTIGTDDNAAIETLKAIKMVKEGLGVKTILGVSNISHGIPAREKINRAFYAMAILNGLDLAIIDPLDKGMIDTHQAASLLAGRDNKAENYIRNNNPKNINQNIEIQSENNIVSKEPSLESIKELTIKGSYDILNVTNKLLKTGVEPLDIINNGLIPGLEIVGDYFKRGEYFLPELMLSAEIAEKTFQLLEKHMKSDEDMQKKATIVIGTVKGDIHDIGKNIVAVILKNHGYNVIDLGKNVSAESFLKAAKKQKADFIGLSALMTTTMMEIPKTIEYVKKSLPDMKFIVGGAVITEEFAIQSGANGYSEDAVSAVKLIERLIVE